jgi:hypothetical protein
VIYVLRWMVPELRAIVTIEVNAASYQDAGERAAVVIRQLAHPSERTVPFYPEMPRMREPGT